MKSMPPGISQYWQTRLFDSLAELPCKPQCVDINNNRCRRTMATRTTPRRGRDRCFATWIRTHMAFVAHSHFASSGLHFCRLQCMTSALYTCVFYVPLSIYSPRVEVVCIYIHRSISLSLSLSIYIHTYIYPQGTLMYVCMHACMSVCMCTCKCVCICMYMYMYMYVYMHAYVFVYVCIQMCIHILYAYTYIYMYMGDRQNKG